MNQKPIIHHALALLFCCATAATAESFYKQDPEFMFRPEEQKSVTTIHRFGPIGMAIDLVQPAFVMKINSIEPDSPAAATGKLKKGQIILSINGTTLKDIDPRIQLGNLITKAEATDGLIRLVVQDDEKSPQQTVDLKIEVLGSYSPTWPLDCPKSDKIVRNFATYLKKDGSEKGFADIGMLFLLSTGDPGDLDYVAQWAKGLKDKKVSGYAWHIGHGGLAVCEYYLRTGDPSVLPVIQAQVDSAAKDQTFGGWGGRGGMASVTYGGGGGHLNAGGTLVVAYLMLAKECGANVPDETLHSALVHFYRWAGRGVVPYGNNLPEPGLADNGKNARLAISMAAAAALTPDGENSIYAKARDTAAMFSFYSNSYMNHGHTGGGVGEIWRSTAMGLLYHKDPQHYREFMESRRWQYEMSRRFDGSFGILNGEGFYAWPSYDRLDWGAGYPLAYTVPRKTLRITGAPPTKFSKLYKLPEIPWGTKADADFVSTEPAVMPDGKRPDLSKETHFNDGGMGFLRQMESKPDEAKLLHYLHHTNSEIRKSAARVLTDREPAFIAKLVQSPDARVRRAMIDAFLGKGADPAKASDPAISKCLFEMVANPEESWFVKEGAMRLIGTLPSATVAPHVDILLPYVKHEEWWLQSGAVTALAAAVAHPDCYRKVLPALGGFMQSNLLINASGPLHRDPFQSNIKNAPKEVQQLASEVFKGSLSGYQVWDGGQPEKTRENLNTYNLEGIAKSLVLLPGGYDVLYQVAKQQNPGEALPYKKLYDAADPSQFSGELKQLIQGQVANDLIPGYIETHREKLLKEASSAQLKPSEKIGDPVMDGLVKLYQNLDKHEYDWLDIGPDREQMEWHYLTFDPEEKMPWDTAKARYRPVTLPKGAEEWFGASFDPVKAGWKTGKQPFGCDDKGQLRGAAETDCPMDFCRCSTAMQTLWDKEVLLLKGSFPYPAFREGYRYRLNIGGMSHVGAGEGYRIYLNGRLLQERLEGVGKRAGAKPVSCIIDKSWWGEFGTGKTDISVITFQGIKKNIKRANFSLWVQEMKVPPLDKP